MPTHYRSDVYMVKCDKSEPTTPDNAAERIAAGSLIAELAGDGYVTTNEAQAIIDWCNEWVRDCEWGEGEGVAIACGVELFLRSCNRHIDGGLAFVLADVRRLAESFSRSHATTDNIGEDADGDDGSNLVGAGSSDKVITRDDFSHPSQFMVACVELVDFDPVELLARAADDNSAVPYSPTILKMTRHANPYEDGTHIATIELEYVHKGLPDEGRYGSSEWVIEPGRVAGALYGIYADGSIQLHAN